MLVEHETQTQPTIGYLLSPLFKEPLKIARVPLVTVVANQIKVLIDSVQLIAEFYSNLIPFSGSQASKSYQNGLHYIIESYLKL